MLLYDSQPILQLMRAVFNSATEKVKVDGLPVVPCALLEAMDGKDSMRYAARVEPSEDGGMAIVKLLSTKIEEATKP